MRELVLTFLQSPTLYTASVVLRSVGLCSVFLTACLVCLKYRELTTGPFGKSLPFSKEVSGSSFLPASMANKLVHLSVIISLFSAVTSVWMLANWFMWTPVVYKKNVQVLSRNGNQFCMRDSHGEFSVRPCEPFPQDMVAGVTLTEFNFIYDSHRDCNQWSNNNVHDEGYRAWRHLDDTPVITAFSRSEATGGTCASPATQSDSRQGTSQTASR